MSGAPGPDRILADHRVLVQGAGDVPIVFAHGYGCDQTMWRLVEPEFRDAYRTVLFDHAGAGHSAPSTYDARRHSRLQGYADDVLRILDALGGEPVVFVGHSVSAMIGALAAIERPSAFRALVMVAPSPCYLNDGDYAGGHSRQDIDQLLETLDTNYLGWSSAMAPVIASNPSRPELAGEWRESFDAVDPAVSKAFGRVTFLSDNRLDLPRVSTKTLVLQCSEDLIAPEPVGRFMAEALPDADFRQLAATGHLPHLSAPQETANAVREWFRVHGI